MGCLAAAYRWDSRVVLGLALSTLAAWRGVTMTLALGLAGPGRALSASSGVGSDALRTSAVLIGGLYLAAAVVSVRLGRKAHFESVYAPAGLLLLLGAIQARLGQEGPPPASADALEVLTAAERAHQAAIDLLPRGRPRDN